MFQHSHLFGVSIFQSLRPNLIGLYSIYKVFTCKSAGHTESRLPQVPDGPRLLKTWQTQTSLLLRPVPSGTRPAAGPALPGQGPARLLLRTARSQHARSPRHREHIRASRRSALPAAWEDREG